MPRNRFDAEIARLALPAFLTLLSEPLYLLADTAVVGHLGTEQLSGLAVASAVLLLAYSLSIFLAYGTTAAVARLLGAGERQEATHQAVQGLWLGGAAGIGFAIAIALFARPLVGIVGAEGAVATNALVYLRISLFGLPFLLLTLAGTGYLRGVQDTRTPLIVAVGTAIANLAIELVLIHGFDQGIGASALATVVAQGMGALVYLRAVLGPARAAGVALRPDLPVLGRLLRVGGDLMLRTAALRGSLLVLTAVATRLGRIEVAAHQIAFEIWNLLAYALDALAIAAQAMVGRYLGAGRPDEARAASGRLLGLGVLGGLVATAVLLAFAPLLPALFTKDPAVAELVRFLLWWVAGLQVLGAVAFVLDGVLIGAGDQRFLARAMGVGALVLAAAVAPILPLGLGIGWVWAGFGALMATRAGVLWWRFRGDHWLLVGARR